jgi:hypothetical protein
MRPLAILATALICTAASPAGAQTLLTHSPNPTVQASDALAAVMLNGAAFAPKGPAAGVDPIANLLDREAYAPGVGPVRWTTGEAQLSKPSATGPVDSLRVSIGGAVRAPGGLPLNLSRAEFQTDAYEVTLVRDWPEAVKFEGRSFGVDLTPHAGVGVTNTGTAAEAGATLRLSQRLDTNVAERLRAMGLRDGGESFGDRGRWYLFAAASGRAVGMNMLHGETGWDRAGWTTDAASTLVGDAQLGVGWRKGPLQTSLGYVHREVKGAHMIWGQDTPKDDMLAFSLSIRPHK